MPQKLPAKKAKKAMKPAKKAAKPKAAPKNAAKPKAAKPRAPHRPDPITLPGHHATKMEHAEHERHMAKAEHDHQDPRWDQPKPDAKLLHDHAIPARADHGAMKTRGIPRMNPMINWFRRAPKKKT